MLRRLGVVLRIVVTAFHQLLLRRLDTERRLLEAPVSTQNVLGLSVYGLFLVHGSLLREDLVTDLPLDSLVDDHGLGRQVSSLHHASRVVVVVNWTEIGLLS